MNAGPTLPDSDHVTTECGLSGTPNLNGKGEQTLSVPLCEFLPGDHVRGRYPNTVVVDGDTYCHTCIDAPRGVVVFTRRDVS